jgi:hypothetical protein
MVRDSDAATETGGAMMAACAHRIIATSCYDCLRPAVPIDRDHPFRAIATNPVDGVIGAVG